MIPWILWLAAAWARAGGGQGYSGGGGSSGGGGGGFSGGGGGDGDGLGLLIWLVFEHPVIGIPLLFVVAAVFFYVKVQGHQDGRVVHRTHPVQPVVPGARLAPLRARDPSFSEPLFLDLARLVYTRAHEARGGGDFATLAPYVVDSVVASLRARAPGKPVRDIVLGATRIESAAVSGAIARVVVLFEGNLTEGTSKRFARERWTFARAADTLSPGPDRMRALSCPSCGSPIDTTADGRCRNCDNVITDGRLQWQVVDVRVLLDEPAPPLQLTRGAGVEAGTDLPIVLAPDLPAQLRAFQARHPDFQWEGFRSRVIEVFVRIQQAWSDGKWEQARPFETDFLFQQHRYWIERYAAEGLRNGSANIQVTDVVLARVTVDAYLEAVTVRIFAQMRDWTEDRAGNVVGGSKVKDRVFSEYWTFLRSAGKTARPRDEVDRCPSCGAPLDNVSETGVCGYCDAKITGGDYDWVLSTIDQDEAYRG
ncbi:MAG: TIM44-like domain-containing protein [Pseudomonadota bacterium]|nr:TIM44-like domain-containing protein [Pseudomonadota bacterium]